MLAAEDTGGTTLLLIASINFLNSSSGAIAKRTGSLSLIIIGPQIIFLTT
jgi:hypothetical protein